MHDCLSILYIVSFVFMCFIVHARVHSKQFIFCVYFAANMCWVQRTMSGLILCAWRNLFEMTDNK